MQYPLASMLCKRTVFFDILLFYPHKSIPVHRFLAAACKTQGINYPYHSPFSSFTIIINLHPNTRTTLQKYLFKIAAYCKDVFRIVYFTYIYFIIGGMYALIKSSAACYCFLNLYCHLLLF